MASGKFFFLRHCCCIKVRPHGFWKNFLLLYCQWSFARWYISAIFVYNLSRLCTLNVNRSNKRKWLYTKKKVKSKWYPAKTITDTDYTDDPMFLVNTPAKAKSSVYNLEQAGRGTGFYMNANKRFMCFKQGVISSLNNKPLKLVDKFTYLGGNISSTEIFINICIAKARTTIGKLSIICKSHL